MKLSGMMGCVCLLILLAHALRAQSPQGVFVDQSSLTQEFDPEPRLFVVAGAVENQLPLAAREVEIRLYAPGWGDPKAKIWKMVVAAVPAHSRQWFRLGVPVDELAAYRTFAVRVWQYDLHSPDPEAALALTQGANLDMLRALANTLAQSLRRRPGLLGERFDSATPLQRLCLSEAALRSHAPAVLHQLAERLFAGREVVPWGALQAIMLVARQQGEPSPFPLLEHWQAGSGPQEDLENLLRVVPEQAGPMLWRMRYAGTAAAQAFAVRRLGASPQEALLAQLRTASGSGREMWSDLLRELARAHPRERLLRQALAAAEYHDHRNFLWWAMAIAAGVPVVAVVGGQQVRRYRAARRVHHGTLSSAPRHWQRP